MAKTRGQTDIGMHIQEPIQQARKRKQHVYIMRHKDWQSCE